MNERCQECGAPATVSLSVAPLVRAGETSTQTRGRFCRACAEAARVRMGIPPRAERPKKEPIASWDVVAAHQSSLDALLAAQQALTAYERSLLAEALWEKSRHLPRPVPETVAAWFVRAGVELIEG
jgi:hypothetical protein